METLLKIDLILSILELKHYKVLSGGIVDKITEYPDIKSQYEKDLLRDHLKSLIYFILSNGFVRFIL